MGDVIQNLVVLIAALGCVTYLARRSFSGGSSDAPCKGCKGCAAESRR